MAHNVNPAESPTAKAMDRAIDMAIAGTSPYPEHAAFVDADSPRAGHEITRALDEGYAVVLISADGESASSLPKHSPHSSGCHCETFDDHDDAPG